VTLNSPLTIVVAPDSFKGSINATDAARAIAEGWRRVRPQDQVIQLPIADGGEGTLNVLEAAHPHAQRVPITVTGPNDRPVQTTWLRYTDPGGADVGVVELASTSGITLQHELHPLTAHTRGFGQAARSALNAGVDQLILTIGGSASTDCGAGFLTELGAAFLDAAGKPVANGNQGLAQIVTIDLNGLQPMPRRGAVVLMDVTNPLLGPQGAVAVYGPQKGITDDLAAIAEHNLERFVEAASRHFPIVDPARAGTGAAGGTGFGLTAWGAQLTPGADGVAQAVRLTQRLHGADLVITGEGRYDAQTAAGKAPMYTAELAHRLEVPAALIAGAIAGDASPFTFAISLTDLAGSTPRAIAEPTTYLSAAGAELARNPAVTR